MSTEPVRGVYLSSRTNSQMFTKCCDVAICSDQERCPSCRSLVIYHDEPSAHKRGMSRWSYCKTYQPEMFK